MTPLLYLAAFAFNAVSQLAFIFAGAFLASVGWRLGRKFIP